VYRRKIYINFTVTQRDGHNQKNKTLCISLCGLSYRSSFAFQLTELFNICRFKQASLSASWLCITFRPENLLVFIALHGAFTFSVIIPPLFHFVRKNVLETELGGSAE
jgi:hypothetical protein